MNDFVKLLKEREENGTVKINVTLTDWKKGGSLTNENWELTMKYGFFISISRPVGEKGVRTYVYGDSPQDLEGVFYWFFPKQTMSTDENDCYLTGEVWVCEKEGKYEEGFVGENQMTFRWP
ncbi:hypothetical protein MP638_000212 [Amoeboaphelidium occidentale]|nr:hypothetical protein MP638_000212 [Amoeboaphelidium occidentale]